MELSIISLNYKKPQLTLASIESVQASYKKQFEKNEFEYIVVDNNSQDDSGKILAKEIKKYKGFSFIQNTKNSGFGAGNNIGAHQAKGKYLLFLNNDTVIKSHVFLDMVSYLDNHPQVGVLGGELRNFDNTKQSSVGKFYSVFQVTLLLLGGQRFGVTDQNPSAITPVDWVKGAFLMIRKDVFEKVGRFDEHIFMYTEDMELCFRVRKLGFTVVFYPTEGVLHKDQGSSNRSFAIVHIYKGILYFYQKHMPVWQMSLVKLLLISKATILIIIGRMIGNSYLIDTYEKALTVLR